MQFAGQQVGIIWRHLAAGDIVHGAIDRRCRWPGQGRIAGVAPAPEMPGGEGAGLGLLVGRDAAILIAPGADIGDREREPIEVIGVAGEVDQRRKQRRNIGRFEMSADVGVAVGERFGHDAPSGSFPADYGTARRRVHLPI